MAVIRDGMLAVGGWSLMEMLVNQPSSSADFDQRTTSHQLVH